MSIYTKLYKLEDELGVLVPSSDPKLENVKRCDPDDDFTFVPEDEAEKAGITDQECSLCYDDQRAGKYSGVKVITEGACRDPENDYELVYGFMSVQYEWKDEMEREFGTLTHGGFAWDSILAGCFADYWTAKNHEDRSRAICQYRECFNGVASRMPEGCSLDDVKVVKPDDFTTFVEKNRDK